MSTDVLTRDAIETARAKFSDQRDPDPPLVLELPRFPTMSLDSHVVTLEHLTRFTATHGEAFARLVYGCAVHRKPIDYIGAEPATATPSIGEQHES